MSSRNGDKAKHNRNRRKRIWQRAKARVLRAQLRRRTPGTS